MKSVWCLIALFLLFSPINAAADTFTLWEKFPKTDNGQYNFWTAGVTDTPEVLTLLNYTAPYSFSRAGVVVKRSTTYPLILLQPSSTETAVLYGVPPETDTINVSGAFSLPAWIVYAHVFIGTVLFTDLSTFNPLFFYDFNKTNHDGSFDIPNVVVDPTHALVFAVDQGTGDAQAYLQGTITSVPVPDTLILLSSGLLGLAGWRRLRRR